MPSGYNIRPQIEAREEARLQVQRRYQRQYHRLRRVRLRGAASKVRRLQRQFNAFLAEETPWDAEQQETSL